MVVHFFLRHSVDNAYTRDANTYSVFRRTLLRYVRLMAWAVRLSSVCRLYYCNVVAPYSDIWNFRQYCCALGTGTGAVCIKIFEKKFLGILGDHAS